MRTETKKHQLSRPIFNGWVKYREDSWIPQFCTSYPVETSFNEDGSLKVISIKET